MDYNICKKSNLHISTIKIYQTHNSIYNPQSIPFKTQKNSFGVKINLYESLKLVENRSEIVMRRNNAGKKNQYGQCLSPLELGDQRLRI